MDTAGSPLPRSHPGLVPGRRPSVLFDRGDPAARYEPQPFFARFGGVLAQRCPVCLRSPMFRDPWHMLDKCPGCGHHHRQPVGFARAAMHGVCGMLTVAAAGGVFVGLLRVVTRVLPPDSGLEAAVLTALGIQLLILPAIHRYARVIWAHLSVRTGP